MTDEHLRRATEFQEAVWVALEGWEVLTPELTREIELFDELVGFSGISGSGLAVGLAGFPTEDSAEGAIDANIERKGNAPTPDDIRVSKMPYGGSWWVRFRFIRNAE